LPPIRHKEQNSSQHYQHNMVLKTFKGTNIETRVPSELDSCSTPVRKTQSTNEYQSNVTYTRGSQ